MRMQGSRAEAWLTRTCTGSDRYTQIIHHYGQAGRPLQARDFDEVCQKAREIRADFLADLGLHPDGREAPDWLLSVKRP